MAAGDSPSSPLPGGASEGNLLPSKVAIMRPNNRPSNIIITSKYTILPSLRWFLPWCLYELLSPFKRFANFFYLLVGFLQMVEYFNPSQFPSTWASLFVIVLVDLFVLLKDDLARHRADRQTNSQPVTIIAPDASHPQSRHHPVIERSATWADVQVGDVVRVLSKEAFPADMVLLRGSNPPGTCWVSTKALDGESDMKLRLAPSHGLVPDGDDSSHELQHADSLPDLASSIPATSASGSLGSAGGMGSTIWCRGGSSAELG